MTLITNYFSNTETQTTETVAETTEKVSVKHELFTCKEHYLAFRQAFARSVNDERTKSYPNSKYSIYGWIPKPKNSRYGWIQAEHFILLNLLRDKPTYRGFSLVTNKTKLANGMVPCLRFYQAIEKLRGICRPCDTKTCRDEYIEDLIAPFEGTVSKEMLNKLHKYIPKINYFDMWGARGSRIIPAFIRGEISHEDVWKEAIDEN